MNLAIQCSYKRSSIQNSNSVRSSRLLPPPSFVRASIGRTGQMITKSVSDNDNASLINGFANNKHMAAAVISIARIVIIWLYF